jgi:hypothetical protein
MELNIEDIVKNFQDKFLINQQLLANKESVDIPICDIPSLYATWKKILTKATNKGINQNIDTEDISLLLHMEQKNIPYEEILEKKVPLEFLKKASSQSQFISNWYNLPKLYTALDGIDIDKISNSPIPMKSFILSATDNIDTIKDPSTYFKKCIYYAESYDFNFNVPINYFKDKEIRKKLFSIKNLPDIIGMSTSFNENLDQTFSFLINAQDTTLNNLQMVIDCLIQATESTKNFWNSEYIKSNALDNSISEFLSGYTATDFKQLSQIPYITLKVILDNIEPKTIPIFLTCFKFGGFKTRVVTNLCKQLLSANAVSNKINFEQKVDSYSGYLKYFYSIGINVPHLHNSAVNLIQDAINQKQFAFLSVLKSPKAADLLQYGVYPTCVLGERLRNIVFLNSVSVNDLHFVTIRFHISNNIVSLCVNQRKPILTVRELYVLLQPMKKAQNHNRDFYFFLYLRLMKKNNSIRNRVRIIQELENAHTSNYSFIPKTDTDDYLAAIPDRVLSRLAKQPLSVWRQQLPVSKRAMLTLLFSEINWEPCKKDILSDSDAYFLASCSMDKIEKYNYSVPQLKANAFEACSEQLTQFGIKYKLSNSFFADSPLTKKFLTSGCFKIISQQKIPDDCHFLDFLQNQLNGNFNSLYMKMNEETGIKEISLQMIDSWKANHSSNSEYSISEFNDLEHTILSLTTTGIHSPEFSQNAIQNIQMGNQKLIFGFKKQNEKDMNSHAQIVMRTYFKLYSVPKSDTIIIFLDTPKFKYLSMTEEKNITKQTISLLEDKVKDIQQTTKQKVIWGIDQSWEPYLPSTTNTLVEVADIYKHTLLIPQQFC